MVKTAVHARAAASAIRSVVVIGTKNRGTVKRYAHGAAAKRSGTNGTAARAPGVEQRRTIITNGSMFPGHAIINARSAAQ